MGGAKITVTDAQPRPCSERTGGGDGVCTWGGGSSDVPKHCMSQVFKIALQVSLTVIGPLWDKRAIVVFCFVNCF